MAEAVLKVTGMTCGHCVKAVSGALQRIEGVRSANVDLEQGRAVVEYDEGCTTPEELKRAVMDEGYSAEEGR